MDSVVSLLTFTNASNVPIITFVDMQKEHMAAPRPLAISGGDGALTNCRTGLPGPSHRHHKVTCLYDALACHGPEEVSVGATDDWIASTLPRKLGIGNNAGG